ncbi:MAG: hypothetical protein QOH63_2301 [Acidobacteriota bacterium]|jgi:uncharacterized membrane protein|nr:hypothetical protein [Acidobacteriota bacterium]
MNAERGMKDSSSSIHHSSFRVHRSTSSLIPPPSSLPSIVWAITATITLAFVSLIVIAPLALTHGHEFTALVIYKSFSRFCHQIPERSFYLDGHPLAVCARCAGIYFGFAASVLLYPLARSLRRSDAPARKWLLVAIVPAALDFALDFFGIRENTHLTRLVTGALLGGVTAFYVVPGLLDLSRMSFRRSTVDQG